MIFKIATVLTWNINHTTKSINLNVMRDNKMLEMVMDEKTDGVWYYRSNSDVDKVTIVRNWIDESSADEWINFVTAAALSENVELISVVKEPIIES